MENEFKLGEYDLPIEVRSYEADAWGELTDSMVLRMLEHAAWAASAAGGFDIPWYEQQGTAWVVRRMTLARHGAIRFGDNLIGRTWISDLRRVRSNRDYELRQAASGVVMVTARADWVYVNRAQQRPVAVDPTLAARVELRPAATDLAALPLNPLTGTPRLFSAHRHATRSEADSMNHVNNAVYATWLDDALADALADAGVPLADPGRPGPRLQTTHLVLDYLQSAHPGDAIEIRTHLLAPTSDPTILAWHQQILRAPTAEPLLTCVSQRRLVDGDGLRMVAAVVE